MKISKILILFVAIVFTMLSCDKIEEPFVENIVKPVTDKKVLLEDFTGQKCVNCPQAHEIAHQLQDSYGDNLIVVAVHSGFFATPAAEPYTYDFRTDAGNAYESYFNVQTYPTGTVDRVSTDGNYLIDKDGWGTEVAQQLEEAPAINIDINSEISDNIVSGEIDLYFLNSVSSQAYIQIWITEDSIVSPQLTPEGDDLNYLHMHVLRGAINGDWGQALPSSSYSEDDEVTINIPDFTLNEEWDQDQLSIVAFIYDEATKEVLQVENFKFKKDNGGGGTPERIQRVLLEDFTGQKCVNCPQAHEIAHNLQEFYGDDELIAVAIHAGFFATPAADPYTYDFRTEAGNEYESFFSVQTYPSGMVNRVSSGGNYLIDKDGWGTAAAAEFEKVTPLEVTIKPNLSGNKISGEVELYFFEDFNTQAYVQIYVIEDNIVSPQLDQSGNVLDYNHMHVLRGAINGKWGELLPSSYTAEESTSISFSNYEIGDDWNTDELTIVAYVYDASTKEVIQVNKKKL